MIKTVVLRSLIWIFVFVTAALVIAKLNGWEAWNQLDIRSSVFGTFIGIMICYVHHIFPKSFHEKN